MVKRVSVVNWKFDAPAWARLLQSQDDDTLNAARELSGLTEGGWRHWMKGTTLGTYQHPGMQNFLNVCNLLDADPRDYFTVDEVSEGMPPCHHADWVQVDYHVAPDRGSGADYKIMSVRQCRDCKHSWTHSIKSIFRKG